MNRLVLACVLFTLVAAPLAAKKKQGPVPMAPTFSSPPMPGGLEGFIAAEVIKQNSLSWSLPMKKKRTSSWLEPPSRRILTGTTLPLAARIVMKGTCVF